MQILTKIGNNVTFRGLDLVYLSSEKLDDNMIHVHFETQTNLFFVNDTILNGIIYENTDLLISAFDL